MMKLKLCFSFLFILFYIIGNVYKSEAKGNKFGIFLDLCQWIEAKDTVRHPIKTRLWLQEAVSVFRCILTDASLESEHPEA